MSEHKKIPAAVIAAAIIFLIIAGIFVKSASCVPVLADKSAPQQAVLGFFDALCDGDYVGCCEYVNGYSTLGLDDTKIESGNERMVYDALLESYSFQILGEPYVSADGRVYQRVMFTSLDVGGMSNDIESVFNERLLQNIEAAGDHSAVYTSDGQYTPVIIEKTLEDILTELLSSPERYYSSAAVDVELVLVNGEWKMLLSDELTKLITGDSIKEAAE